MAVEDFNMRLERGSVVALIGPSGSGKSTVAKAILRILPPIAKVSGEVYLDGINISYIPEGYMRDLRLKRISYIPQGSSRIYLNPTLKIAETVKRIYKSRGVEPEEGRIRELLSEVDLEPGILDRYPYMLSGGQLQRILIFISLLFNPEYLIADEPTSALDVITQRSIARAFRSLVRSKRLGLLVITHDIAFARAVADYAIVLYRGRVVEYGDIQDLIRRPKSEITRALVEGSMVVE